MIVAEVVEGNLSNIFGVTIAERQCKKSARCVAEKH